MCNDEVVRIKKEFKNRIKTKNLWGRGRRGRGWRRRSRKGLKLRPHLVLLLRVFGRVWMQNLLTTKTIISSLFARSNEERVIDHWSWRWWWKIGSQQRRHLTHLARGSMRRGWECKLRLEIRLTTKATFDSPCARQNEERVRMQITVKNRVNNKGDVWLILYEAEWGEGENEDGGENKANNKGDIWLTLCEAEWGEGENANYDE